MSDRRRDEAGGGAAGRPVSRDGGMSGVLAALSDPTRRALLDVLVARGGASATVAAEALPVSRQAVVKHLAVLERADLVASRRQGREVLYSVRPDRLEEAADWLGALASSWDGRLRAIKEIAEREE